PCSLMLPHAPHETHTSGSAEYGCRHEVHLDRCPLVGSQSAISPSGRRASAGRWRRDGGLAMLHMLHTNHTRHELWSMGADGVVPRRLLPDDGGRPAGGGEGGVPSRPCWGRRSASVQPYI